MKTSFHGNKILFASAIFGIVIGFCSVISTACLKYSSKARFWNARYEIEKSKNEVMNEKQIAQGKINAAD